MGSGNTKMTRPRSCTSLIPREPEDEKYHIPEEEPNYPVAIRSSVPVEDIYDPKDNREIYIHALNTPQESESSWESLVGHLTSKYRTDIAKVRCIFTWLGLQDIENGNYVLVSTPDCLEDTTPRGFKKTIQQGKGSYASFFALLCRKAGIRCAIIKGLSKGFGYDVGVTEVNHLKDKWNAVYIDGWRLIHPLLAFQTVISYKRGKWVPDKMAEHIKVEDLAEEVDQTAYHDFNEYFFLAEPSEFIYLCLPEKEKWQMCSPVLTKESWMDSPFLMKRFHDGFNLSKKFRTTLKSKKGYCSLLIQAPETKDDSVDYQLAYDFFFNYAKGKADTEDVFYLDKYVIVAKDCEKKVWILEARLPVAGLYRITVYGGLSTEAKLPWISDLAIKCKKPAKNIKPYPDCSKLGFGPVHITTKAGLFQPSHPNGILFLKPQETYHITFKIQQKVCAMVKLISEEVDISETSKWTSITINHQGSSLILDVVIKLQQEGEYAMEIFVKKNDEPGIENWENVCNYYLSTDPPRRHGMEVKDKGYKTAIEVDVDKAIETTKKGTDLFEVRNTVEEMKEVGLREEEGSFGKASLKMEYLELAKSLKDAINRKSIEPLKVAIEQAEKSDHTQRLNSLIVQAKKELENLSPHMRYMNSVLKMKEEDLQELVEAEDHAIPVQDVLKAALLLLGENPRDLETWESIKATFLSKDGKTFQRRVKDFDINKLSNEAVIEVGLTIAKYEDEDISEASIDASTLFRWINSVVERKIKQGS